MQAVNALFDNALSSILLILAYGYSIYRLREETSSSFVKYEGYDLYFRVLIYGISWHFLFSFLVPLLPKICEKEINSDIIAFPVAVSLYLLSSSWKNLWFSKKPELRNAFYLNRYKKSALLFEYHILQALTKRKQVMLTMESGKVYIGFVSDFQRRENTKWMTLLVLHSGYRGNENQKLNITTSYVDALENISESDNSFNVTLPVNKIASLQFFNEDYYIKFFKENTDAKP